MAWWDNLFRTRRKAPTDYRVAFNLYSRDGKRGAEVRQRRDGTWWYVDEEWVAGTTFKYRGSGEAVGPFVSSDAAETAASTRAWFNDGDDASAD